MLTQRLIIYYYLITKQYEKCFYYLLNESKKNSQSYVDYMNLRKYVTIGSMILKKMQSPPQDVKMAHETLGDIPCLHAIPSVKPKRTIIYLHGGSFMMELKHTSHETIIGNLAKFCEADVWAVDYRVAPEYMMPAASEDCFKAYLALLEKGTDPNETFVIGDSAGGYLTLALLLDLRDSKKRLPKAAVALSPVTGANSKSGSYISNAAIDPLITQPQVDYVGTAAFGVPCCQYPQAPLNRNLKDMPPMLILVGGKELLYDDSILFAHKAKEAGVDLTLDINEEMFHAYPIFLGIIPQAKEGFDKIVSFVKEHG